MPRFSSISRDTLPYSKYQWQTAGLLLVSYLAIYELAARFLPAAAELHPATAFALVALFFGGLGLWPVVYITALVSAFLAGAPALSLMTAPVAVTLQAFLGAYILRRTHVDPLFRRYRDTFYLIGTTIVVSLISPLLEALGDAIHGAPYTIITWGQAYAAAIFCFLIITPFLMRWFAKPRFSRRPLEILETVAVFAVLLGIDYALFIRGIPSVIGIPLVYLLLIPLFLIALRLRPRFVTLALVLTSILAIGRAITGNSAILTTQLFDIESFIVALAIIFYVIVSQEEDRRVSTNIIHSQLATLENAIARIRSESNAKNDFIAILGHELRNPLSPVVLGIETMQLKGAYDAEDAAMLDMMADRMNTVRRLLDDLLDISRISEGKLTLKHETVDLGSVLERAIISTEHTRKEMHQSITYRFPATPAHDRRRPGTARTDILESAEQRIEVFESGRCDHAPRARAGSDRRDRGHR